MKRILFSILLLPGFMTSFSQEEFIEPSKLLSRFYFKQLTGGVVLLKARFDELRYPQFYTGYRKWWHFAGFNNSRIFWFKGYSIYQNHTGNSRNTKREFS